LEANSFSDLEAFDSPVTTERIVRNFSNLIGLEAKGYIWTLNFGPIHYKERRSNVIHLTRERLRRRDRDYSAFPSKYWSTGTRVDLMYLARQDRLCNAQTPIGSDIVPMLLQ
jgi:hypothetical protein